MALGAELTGEREATTQVDGEAREGGSRRQQVESEGKRSVVMVQVLWEER